ncbi:MAG: hypothetical protein P8Y96_01280 [Desulfuromonadales bacterium]
MERFRGVDTADFDRFVLGGQQQDIFAGIVDFAEVFLVDLDHHDPELSGTSLIYCLLMLAHLLIQSQAAACWLSVHQPDRLMTIVADDSWLQGDRMPL